MKLIVLLALAFIQSTYASDLEKIKAINSKYCKLSVQVACKAE